MQTDLTVAGEIRAALGRLGKNRAWLADEMEVTQTWISRRLAGSVPISVNDLTRFATALGVPMTDLLPTNERESA